MCNIPSNTITAIAPVFNQIKPAECEHILKTQPIKTDVCWFVESSNQAISLILYRVHPQLLILCINRTFHFIDLKITPQISISPSVNVVEGDRVQIRCQVQYSSDLELFLTKDSTILRQFHTSFSYSLTVRAEDSGVYVCKAEKGSVQKKIEYRLTVTGN